MSKQLLSVLICSYNNTEQLALCLQSVRRSINTIYELIVVDDGSLDNSYQVALVFADKAVKLEKNSGRSAARNRAASLASGQILVFIDSDVCIYPGSLHQIASYFKHHPDIAALTGLLSKEHPNKNFYSQYKNLYMHFMFTGLPEEVTFLYGSIHAVLANSFLPYGDVVDVADDTALGQKLFSRGERIAFLRTLEVIHLKKYTAKNFFTNDFIIPFDMARIFIKFKGWKQLGKHNTGFVHASKSQLLSVIISFSITMLYVLFHNFARVNLVAICLFFIWAILHLKFFLFLFKEKGLAFLAGAIFITFFDNLVMAAGIITGVLKGFWDGMKAPVVRH